MSRSRKKTPVSTFCCCKSQKRGKQFCHRKFRRKERMMIKTSNYDRLPFLLIQVTNQWDLGESIFHPLAVAGERVDCIG